MARFKMKEPPAGWAVIPFNGGWLATKVIMDNGKPLTFLPLIDPDDRDHIKQFRYRWQAIAATENADAWHNPSSPKSLLYQPEPLQ